MVKSVIFPGKYVQGVGVLEQAGSVIAPLGKNVLIVWDKFVKGLVSKRIEGSLKEKGCTVGEFVFSGECSKNQRDLGIQKAKQVSADVVVGVGGGKAIDVAKAIGFNVNAKVVSLPTIASNDAPTSSFSVYYTDEGVADGFDGWPRNPDVVLVDTQIVAEAPVRWLVSGIGDALATWFEAEASYKARRPAFSGGVPTLLAMHAAHLCYDILRDHALQAKMDVENKVVTPALEKVVEANVLLSGIGWESGGLATAHTLGNNLTILPCTHPYSHGEKVAFGLATQLCLDDDTDPEELLDVFDLMAELGLPVTFAQLGMDKLSAEELMAAARTLTEPGNFLHNHTFTVNAYDLYCAMVKADALGRERLALTE